MNDTIQAEQEARKVRRFKVLVPSLTLPGAGMAAGVESGRPHAMGNEIVEEGEIGKHLLSLFDANHPRTRRILEEIEPVEAEQSVLSKGSISEQEGEQYTHEGTSHEGGKVDAPWDDYDKLTSADVLHRLAESDPETVDAVKRYEALQARPRTTVLDYEAPAAGGGSTPGEENAGS